MTTVTDPRFMELHEWADAVAIDLQEFGIVPRLDDMSWKDWARVVVSLSPSLQQAAPDPDGFDAWREWAERFVSAVT